MAINTKPLWVGQPNNGRGVITASYTANTRSDGNGTIGTDMIKVFTGDATNGSYIAFVRLTPYAIVANTATTLTTARVFVSTVATGATTSADTSLISEQGLPSQTANSSTGTNVYPTDIPINQMINPGETLLISMHHVPAANTGWHVVVFGGDYTAQP